MIVKYQSITLKNKTKIEFGKRLYEELGQISIATSESYNGENGIKELLNSILTRMLL